MTHCQCLTVIINHEGKPQTAKCHISSSYSNCFKGIICKILIGEIEFKKKAWLTQDFWYLFKKCDDYILLLFYSPCKHFFSFHYNHVLWCTEWDFLEISLRGCLFDERLIVIPPVPVYLKHICDSLCCGFIPAQLLTPYISVMMW